MVLGKILVVGGCTLFLVLAQGAEPDWSEEAPVPRGGRGNLYQLNDQEFRTSVRAGKIHAEIYPVESTALVLPVRPFKNFLGEKKFNDLFKWLGLHEFPKESSDDLNDIPFPGGVRPNHLLGYSPIERYGVESFTISCAVCHTAQLFGKTVFGMTNRFPRANVAFFDGKKAIKFFNSEMYKLYKGATPEEVRILEETRSNIKKVGVKKPLLLGLDTSLSQVALSLNLRSPDAWATPSHYFERSPRPDPLDTIPGDSKPAVWWNLKYKNRWLSDGSVISGNPIFTNILWNEIGRGADLHVLQDWLSANASKIRDLTAAVFSIEAPRIVEFFPAEKIDLNRAKRGQKIYSDMCLKCHGKYEKAWDLPGNENLIYADKLKTVSVRYQTKIKDVGTDPWRRLMMKSLEKLNDLEISKINGTVVKAQEGYVPPPLVGIWARWPYFHNNSVPSLCEVLNVGSKRPQTYYAGEALDSAKDFDFDCNGYPQGKDVPLNWRRPLYRYDSSRQGLSNLGHDEGIIVKEGVELLTPEDKGDLIQFLQTL